MNFSDYCLFGASDCILSFLTLLSKGSAQSAEPIVVSGQAQKSLPLNSLVLYVLVALHALILL